MTTVVEPPSPAPSGAAASAIELRGIGKRFPGVIANHDIDITIRTATIHALVGENGAGKSTLMKILYGVQKPDDGTITRQRRAEVAFSTPTDAIAQGIGMVFQHFMLADNLTVLENVTLGAEKLHGIGDAARAEILAISKRYGFGLDPDELVETLGVGERQRVEILKVLYRGAKIIILDEPTAVLVPQEVDALVREPARAQGPGPHPDLHLPQARRGARGRRRHHRHASRHHRRLGQAGRRHRAQARRADGRQRAALARAPRSPRSPTRCCSACATSSSTTRSAAPC